MLTVHVSFPKETMVPWYHASLDFLVISVLICRTCALLACLKKHSCNQADLFSTVLCSAAPDAIWSEVDSLKYGKQIAHYVEPLCEKSSWSVRESSSDSIQVFKLISLDLNSAVRGDFPDLWEGLQHTSEQTNPGCVGMMLREVAGCWRGCCTQFGGEWMTPSATCIGQTAQAAWSGVMSCLSTFPSSQPVCLCDCLSSSQ